MTKENIEGWRAQFLVAFQGVYHGEIDALCDLALKSLDQGAQEAVAWISPRDLEVLLSSQRNGKKSYMVSVCSDSTTISANSKVLPLFRHPAPTAELIEAQREEFAKIYQGRKGNDSICAGTEAFEAARRITELLAASNSTE